MKEFKEWWSEQEIFAGEGAMDAAEQAWDAAHRLTVDHVHDVVIDHCETAEECRQEIVNYSIFDLWVTHRDRLSTWLAELMRQGRLTQSNDKAQRTRASAASEWSAAPAC